MTPDPRSKQTAHRMTRAVHWVDKPLVFTKMIRNTLRNGAIKINPRWTKFFRESSTSFLKGPPYENQLQVDGKFTWQIRRDEEAANEQGASGE